MNRRTELTFKHNLKQGRHGWVRLTPAYSVKLVEAILNEHPGVRCVLDPFSGTGTTGVVCGEWGIDCDLGDINPFLVWLATAKTYNYSFVQIEQAQRAANRIVKVAQAYQTKSNGWIPPISNIARWWSSRRLAALSKLHFALAQQSELESPTEDLLKIAFCRVIIRWSNAAFNHQSMSFKAPQMFLDFDEEMEIYQSFLRDVLQIAHAATSVVSGHIRVKHQDARLVESPEKGLYDCVITSPPYPNRISYIRELRPYMYWLGYLNEAREAGELDWKAIGGTWGIATSRLATWAPEIDVDLPQLQEVVQSIDKHSSLLSKYVHKYFVDISTHLKNLRYALQPGAKLFYIVGNSKFYDTIVPVEEFYAEMMQQHGYVNVAVQLIRKRNSKKELYEFMVTSEMPK